MFQLFALFVFVTGHIFLHILSVVGDDVVSEYAGSVGGDEEVVLDADAAKVAVLVYDVKVEILGIGTLGFPLVDESGDEVDARLISDDESLLQAPAEAEAGGAELGRRLYLVIKSDVLLSESFHIVYVHAEHVAESVGEEERVGAGCCCLLGIAAHEADLLEPVDDMLADFHVDVVPFDAGLSQLEGEIMALLDDCVDLALAIGKFAVDRGSAGVVAAVVVISLGAGVDEEQAARLEEAVAGIAMHDLAVLCDDGGEGYHGAKGIGDAIEHAADEMLRDTRCAETHGCGVHLAAYGACVLYLTDLGLALDGAHTDDGLDKLPRGLGALLSGRDAEELLHHDLYVMAIGREVVDGLSGLCGGGDNLLETGEGSRVGYAYLRGHICYTVYTAVPDDVVYVDIVAEQILLVIVDIDDADESVALQAKVVEECAVLTEVVDIAGVVGGAIVVARQKDEATAHKLLQGLAALSISLFIKHRVAIFMIICSYATKLRLSDKVVKQRDVFFTICLHAVLSEKMRKAKGREKLQNLETNRCVSNCLVLFIDLIIYF